MATGPESCALPKSAPVRSEVVQLVREKRYEEALAVLYRARSELPADRELQASIERLKEFLGGAYAKQLGGLDQVAGPIPVSASRSPDALLVARYIDGSSTFADIVEMCPLGRLRTLQVLVGLYTGREVASPFSERTPLSRRQVLTMAAPAADADPGPLTVRAHGLERGSQAPPPVSTPFPLPVVETEEERRYREEFTRGTAAFVQRRYADAAEAFEACTRMRPSDQAASVMLRRALRDLGG